MICDREGNSISCWGEGHFVQPHGIFIGPDDSVYLVDNQLHTVEKYTPGGELLMTLPREMSWGRRGWGMPLMLRAPSNQPTGLALGPSGEMFVSDGYANFLVHKFSPEGELLKTWGEPGAGIGKTAHMMYLELHFGQPIEELLKGPSLRKVGRKLGVSAVTVIRWRHRLGIDRQQGEASD